MKISQRQARYFRKRALELEAVIDRQKQRWSGEWAPGWVNIETLTLSDVSFAKIATTRSLGHAVVVIADSEKRIRFYADKL